MNIKILSSCFLVFSFFPLVIANAVTTTPLSGAAIKSAPTASDVVLGTDTTTGQTRNFQLGKLSAVLDWSAWPNGSVFAANTMVAYQGQIYKCLQLYTKNSGDTPAAFTAYWSVTGGGVTSYTALADKPTIPDSLADLSADTTHRVVTDTEKTTWNGKESALGAPTTSGWCLKSNTSGVRSWGACGSFDASGSYSPTGTWDFTGATVTGLDTVTLPPATEGQILQADSGGVYRSVSVIEGLINDTGTGTDDLWSASKNITMLGGKSDTSHTHTGTYEPADADIIKVSDIDSKAKLEAIVGESLGESGTSGYVQMSSAPYSDVACTNGQYGYYGSTAYLCTGGFWASKWTLTAHSSASPSGNSDTFSGTGVLSASWSDAGSGTVVKSNVTQDSGIAKATATYAYNGARWAESSSDISQAVIKGQDAASAVNYVAVRMGASVIGYAVGPATVSSSNWTQVQFFKNGGVLGAAQTLGSPVSWGVDHTYRLVASGTSPVTLSVYIDGSGSPVATMTDSSSTITSGNPGFYMYTGGDITMAGIDNWQDY